MRRYWPGLGRFVREGRQGLVWVVSAGVLVFCTGKTAQQGLLPAVATGQVGAAGPDSTSLLDSSTVIAAMATELNRSLDSLEIQHGVRPYFLSYLLWDIQSFVVQASMGGLEMAGRDREHYLDVDLRLGNYEFDNSKFVGSVGHGQHLRASLPLRNDSLLLRHALWSATDGNYKNALETLPRKRAFVSRLKGYVHLPDFSENPATRSLERDAFAWPDSVFVAAKVVELSATWPDSNWLLESRVSYQFYYTTLYYLDSEGTSYIKGMAEHTLLTAAMAQADDGMPFWDYARRSSRDDGGALLIKGFGKEITAAFERMKNLKDTPVLERYRGPVLFSGSAAAVIIQKSLLDPQANLRPLVSNAMREPFLLQMHGRRYFPPGFYATARPGRTSFRGKRLFGHYGVDDQGRPGRSVRLVDDGRLVAFLTGKAPIKNGETHRNNGHWRYGQVYPSVVEVQGAPALTRTDLRLALRRKAQEEGNHFGLEVSRFSDPEAQALLRHPLTGYLDHSQGGGGPGVFLLPMPLVMHRVDLATGERKPVRGLSFSPVDSKSLRTLSGMGGTWSLFEPRASYSILCPDLLFDLLDLDPAYSTQPELPYLPLSSREGTIKSTATGQ